MALPNLGNLRDSVTQGPKAEFITEEMSVLLNTNRCLQLTNYLAI